MSESTAQRRAPQRVVRIGPRPGETDEDFGARHRASMEGHFWRYGAMRHPTVQWHEGAPDSEGDWWIVEVVPKGEDHDAFDYVAHVSTAEYLVDGVVRLMIESRGMLYLPENYRRILAHAPFTAPKPPGTRARVVRRTSSR